MPKNQFLFFSISSYLFYLQAAYERGIESFIEAIKRDKYQFKYWQKIFDTKIAGGMGKAKESLCDLCSRFLRCITHD